MKSIILSLIIACSFFNVAHSQGGGYEGVAASMGSNPTVTGSGLISNDPRYQSGVNKGYVSYKDILLEYQDFDGSPFLHGKEITVDLILVTGGMIKDVIILYDLYNFEIIVKQNEEEDLILDQLQYTSFIYNNDGEVETYKRVFDGKIKFCKVLYENKDFAFISTQKIRIADKATPIPGQGERKRKFITKSQHFISTKKTINKTSLKKEKLLQDLPYKYRGQVGKAKKKMKFKKLKKEKDYVELMEGFEEN